MTFGTDRDGARNDEPLLLAAGQAGARRMKPVLDLIPETGPLEGGLDDFLEFALRGREAMNTGAVGDVVEDRFRERVRLLEHHADASAEQHRIDRSVVDVLAVDLDLALDAAAFDGVVHPVD